jgi:glutathione peroxidase-family protein
MKILLAICIVGVSVLAYAKKTAGTSSVLSPESITTIHGFSLRESNGDEFPLDQLKGKVVLIVNVASKCGFTGQYEGLQALYQQYKDKGLVILGIPSNDFGGQEPGTNQTIAEFCAINYNVSFPIMEKSSVKGDKMIPLYKFLTSQSQHPKTGGAISWNFNKFLVDRDGFVVRRYSSFTKPRSKKIINDIDQLLNKKS